MSHAGESIIRRALRVFLAYKRLCFPFSDIFFLMRTLDFMLWLTTASESAFAWGVHNSQSWTILVPCHAWFNSQSPPYVAWREFPLYPPLGSASTDFRRNVKVVKVGRIPMKLKMEKVKVKKWKRKTANIWLASLNCAVHINSSETVFKSFISLEPRWLFHA